MPIGTQSLQDACGQPRLGNAQDRAAAFRSARSGRQRSAHVLRSAGAPGIGILPTSGQDPAIGDFSLGTKGIVMDFTTEWIRGCLKMRNMGIIKNGGFTNWNNGLPINNKVFCQLLVDLAAMCLFNGSFQGWLFGKLTQFMEPVQSSSLMNLRLFSLIFLSD